MIPGEYILQPDDIIANADRTTTDVVVVNTGDRPVQVGSHFHFFEVNRQLQFDRAAGYGMRLNIPAGTAVRFEPGEEKEVQLVTIGGAQQIFGFNDLVNGEASASNKDQAVQNAFSGQFKNQHA
ncbi:urease subunit beta [Niastella soli]|uniref:Urease subunit beta n=1 Tax=Niastella soli TaxID=2821487 RepID=A0ABS3Z5N9_9BACT|nr:urease subunit beta [Niastella soli]MBO9204985.1 urease subunit beta [Niastella soli]